MRSSLVRSWCAACLLALGCSGNVPIPEFEDGGLLAEASPVPADQLALLEGSFRVPEEDANRALLGDAVSVSVVGPHVSFFTGTDVYAVTRAGCLDEGTRLVLEGRWREAHSERTGLLQLFVEPPEVATRLCSDAPGPEVDPATVRFEGWLDERGEGGERMLALEGWTRPRPHDEFFVVAHRGGCRTSDACGASENSIELIRMAETFGVDAVEVDAIATADGVPILYHDEDFSARLVTGMFCYGPVSEFTLAHVRALCTLEYGERIPTLADALRAVVEETSLRGVWIDVKDARSLPAVLEVGEAERLRAASLGRPIMIVYGLYSDELVQAYIDADPPEASRCLVELSLHDALSTGCQVWAPRWTRGTMAEKVVEAQDSGVVVAFWTIDEREFIDHFLVEARPNALLTNRPWLVYHRFQTLGSDPPGPEPFPLP
jgi:glycerophosphoryl diester phosphodiesterase